MEMKKKTEYNNDDLAVYMATQVVWDSDVWGSLTGRELNKRIKGCKAVKCSANVIWVLSCLRHCDVYYYEEKAGDRYVTVISETDEKKAVCVFSTPRHLPKRDYEDMRLVKSSFTEFYRKYKEDMDTIVINPFTDVLMFPREVIDVIFPCMHAVEEDMDEEMREGISKESLNEVMFRRFSGRKIFCKLSNDSEIVGKAGNSSIALDCLDVTTDAGETVTVYRQDVEYIKEISQ